MKLLVHVTWDPMRGYTSQPCPQLNRSITALSLNVLRKRLLAVAALRRRADTPIEVKLVLDRGARRERDERRAQAQATAV
jgi:hypothetical protein